MSRERLIELAAKRATSGLEGPEAVELRRLEETFGPNDSLELELAAAAVDVALLEAREEMPKALAEQIATSAAAHCATPVSDPSETGNSVAVNPEASQSRVRQFPAETRAKIPSWLPWLAAAASLFLALTAWWPTLFLKSFDWKSTVVEQPVSPEDVLQIAWTATEDPTASGATGTVSWSPSLQEGTMTFQGLEINDPSQFQYQLWIFDGDRDERYPVDGGVFDIVEGQAEISIPIRAKLPVGKPYLFAITVEAPGGVVVSSRERIALVAEAPTA